MRNIKQVFSVDNYYSFFDFLRDCIVCKIPRICEYYFLSTFINGLKPKIQVYVLQHHPHNVLDTYELALIREFELQGVHKAKKTQLVKDLNPEENLVRSILLDTSNVVDVDELILVAESVTLDNNVISAHDYVLISSPSAASYGVQLEAPYISVVAASDTKPAVQNNHFLRTKSVATLSRVKTQLIMVLGCSSLGEWLASITSRSLGSSGWSPPSLSYGQVSPSASSLVEVSPILGDKASVIDGIFVSCSATTTFSAGDILVTEIAWDIIVKVFCLIHTYSNLLSQRRVHAAATLVPLLVSIIPYARKSKPIQPRLPCLLEIKLLNKSQNADNEMLIPRIRLYLKILSLEKSGADDVHCKFPLGYFGVHIEFLLVYNLHGSPHPAIVFFCLILGGGHELAMIAHTNFSNPQDQLGIDELQVYVGPALVLLQNVLHPGGYLLHQVNAQVIPALASTVLASSFVSKVKNHIVLAFKGGICLDRGSYLVPVLLCSVAGHSISTIITLHVNSKYKIMMQHYMLRVSVHLRDIDLYNTRFFHIKDAVPCACNNAMAIPLVPIRMHCVSLLSSPCQLLDFVVPLDKGHGKLVHSVCRHSALHRGLKSITPHYFLQDSSVAASPVAAKFRLSISR